MESSLMKSIFVLLLLVTARYSGKAKTINQLNRELAKSTPVYVFNLGEETDYTVVGFRMFTDKPIWVITKHPKQIQDYISKFSLSDFLQGWEFTFEIEKCIKEHNLTDLYLLQSLGRPDKKITLGDSKTTIEEWQYHSLGVSLFLTNGVVSRYLKVE
jgi:hypothetical protein